MDEELRIIISGGSMGEHIFPAVSITDAIKAKHPEAKILFVGADRHMEMQRVPVTGYEIRGLPIKGFDRTNKLKNIEVLCKLWKSLHMARQIVRDFRPQVAVGVGGYASGTTLYECAKMGIPCPIQGQNSCAGVTNKLLSKRVKKICVAYEGMDRFFSANKTIMTGNPVRQNVLSTPLSVEEPRESFGLNPNKKTILLVSGSLGTGTINRSVIEHLDLIRQLDVQLMWQADKFYHQQILDSMKGKELPNLKVMDFISDMGTVYKAADLVISRADASFISEFQLIGRPVILVLSPNVAEDHQIKNAMALVNKDATLCVKDVNAPDTLIELALDTITNDEKLASFSENIKKMGLRNLAEIIAGEVIKLIKG